MSGKRILLIAFLLVCLMMSACSMPAHPSASIGEGNPKASPDTSPTPSSSHSSTPASAIIEYPQNTENLPAAGSLASFPGVMDSLSMTLEQIITVLGTDFDLIENKAQGYDTYSFPQYQLTFDFDKISKKLSSVSLNGVPYYVYSGAYQASDLNGDGKAEKIVAYEDQNFNGTLLVIDGQTLKVSQATLEYFGNFCELKVLSGYGSAKENLILLSSRGGKQGDVFSWQGGELKSILPQGYDTLSLESLTTIEGNKAVWVNEKENLLYVCPLPERIAKGVESWQGDEAYRYGVTLKPELKDESLVLKVRTSLQIKLSDNYNFMESSDGIYSDVAQATQSFNYKGQGQWEKAAAEGGIKYENAPEAAPMFSDLSIAGLTLYDACDTLDVSLLDLSDYTPDELYAGVLIQKDGLRVGISQNFISFLSLEKGSRGSTLKGLKLSDTREQALSLYGLPDEGFIKDDVWTYYVLEESSSEGEPTLFFNTLNLEFDEDKVCRIWISSYVTAY